MPEVQASEPPGARGLKVLFAPDWRDGVPYQSLLAAGLAKEGVEVDFLAGYRRVLPLWRAMAGRRIDLLHLHWPEAYYPRRGDWLDGFRRARFAADLALAIRYCRLVVTAHNFLPHDRAKQSYIRRNAEVVLRRAVAVIAHSEAARRELIEKAALKPEQCYVIPHGDLSVELGGAVGHAEARERLGLEEGKLCLMFGAIEPYKGIEEVVEYWRKARPQARLEITGRPISDRYAAEVSAGAAGEPGIGFHFGRMSDEQLRLWLSAADCVIFNYRAIFTSGAACLARAWGVPLLIPARLKTVDLEEPDARVLRFDTVSGEFGRKVDEALRTGPDYESARAWRESHAWDRLARETAKVYRRAMA